MLGCKGLTVTCALSASLSLGYKGFLSSVDLSDFDILVMACTTSYYQHFPGREKLLLLP